MSVISLSEKFNLCEVESGGMLTFGGKCVPVRAGACLDLLSLNTRNKTNT